MMSDKITFEESLEEDDWGIIIGKNGELKGMFIPEGEKETDVPPVIVKMCIDCLLYTSPSPRDMRRSRMPSSA